MNSRALRLPKAITETRSILRSSSLITKFLAVAAAGLLLGHSARAQTTYDWTGTTNGNLSGTTTNYSPNGTPGSSDVIRWNAASYTTAPTANANMGIGELLFDSGNTGGVTFGTGALTLTLSGISAIGIQLNAGTGTVSTGSAKFAIGASQSWLNNSSNTFTVGGTINLNANTLTIDGSGASTLSGIMSGTGGSLTKAGTGTLTLSGANTYTGGTTISAGTIKVNNAKALGDNTSAVSVTSGAVLDLNGITMTNTNALALNGTGISLGGALTNSSSTAGTYAGLVTLGSDSSIIARGSGGITLSNVGTITGSGFNLIVGGANNTTVASIIGTGAGGLTKQDAGTLTLTGANTYTGTTTVNGGTLTLGNGTGGSLNASSTLATGGNGVFNYTGAASATQTVASFNANQGFGTVNNTVSGTTLNLGAVTHSARGMVYFGNTTGMIASTTNDATGIIGPWAFLGTGTGLDYAVANGAGVAISSLGAATTLPSAGPGVSTTNYILAGAQAQSANTVGNTLRYTGNAQSLALGTTSLGLSGLMNAGTGLLTISGTAGNPGLVTTAELDIVGNTSGITISSVISGTGSVVSGGVGTTVASSATSATGLLTLSGANTYSGGTVINSGALRASTSTALGTGDVTVTNGAQLQLNGGVTIANTININGSNALFSVTSGGTPNLTGIVNLQGNAGINLATNSGNAAMTLSGTVNLNGFTLTANTVNISPAIIISGVISGSGGITKAGAGVLLLNGTGTNTYTGATAVNTGTLIAKSASSLGTGAGGVTVASGTALIYNASTDAQLAIAGTLGITGTGTTIGGSIGSTTTSAEINVTGNATTNAAAVAVNIYGINGVSPVAGTNTYTLVHGGGAGSTLNNATYSLGKVYNNTNFTVGALSKSATDLQVGITSATALTTAFWRGGTANGASVWAVSDGSASSNWTSTSGGSVQALVPGSGTDVTFSDSTVTTAPTATTLGADMSIKSLTLADTTNVVGLNGDGNTLTIGTGGITANTSGKGGTISAPVILGADQTWTNNSTSALSIGGAISGAHSLTKAGTGTGGVILSGANTYTGATTVSAGLLTLSNALALQNSALDTTNSTNGTSTAGLKTTVTTLTLGGLTGTKNLSSLFTTTSGGYTSVTALTLNPGASVTNSYSGVIADGAAGMTLTKTGAGTQTLAGANAYTGATTVNQGTLIVSGSISGSATSVGSGAVFASGNNLTSTVKSLGVVSDSFGGGNGGSVIVGGTTTSGTNGIGKLNVGGALDLGTTGTTGKAHLAIELGGTTAGSTYDQVAITAAAGVSLNNVQLDLSLINGFGAIISNDTNTGLFNGDTFYIVIGANAHSGTFANAAAPDAFSNGYSTIFAVGGQEFAINYNAVSGSGFSSTGGNDIALMAIPEPGSAVSFLGGLGGLLGVQRLRRRRS